MSDLPNYTLHILAETLIAIHLNFIAGLRTKHNSRAKITRNKFQLSLSNYLKPAPRNTTIISNAIAQWRPFALVEYCTTLEISM